MGLKLLREQQLVAAPPPPEGVMAWDGSRRCWRLQPRGADEVAANLRLWAEYVLKDFDRLLEASDRLSTGMGKEMARAIFRSEVNSTVVGLQLEAQERCEPGSQDDLAGAWGALFRWLGGRWDQESGRLLGEVAQGAITTAHAAEVSLIGVGGALAATVASMLADYLAALIPQLFTAGMERIKQALEGVQKPTEALSRVVQLIRSACEDYLARAQRLGAIAQPQQPKPEERAIWEQIEKMREYWRLTNEAIQQVENDVQQAPQYLFKNWPEVIRTIEYRIKTAAGYVAHAERTAVQIAEEVNRIKPSRQLQETVARMLRAVQGLQQSYVRVYNAAVKAFRFRPQGVPDTLMARMLLDDYAEQYREFLNALVLSQTIQDIAQRLVQEHPGETAEQLAARGKPEVEEFAKGSSEEYLNTLLSLSGLYVAQPPTGLPLSIPTVGELSASASTIKEAEEVLARNWDSLSVSDLAAVERLLSEVRIPYVAPYSYLTALLESAAAAVAERPSSDLAGELDRLLDRSGRYELWSIGLPAGWVKRLDGQTVLRLLEAGDGNSVAMARALHLGALLKALLSERKLNKEDSTPGNPRLDFMSGKPYKVPMHFVLWTHLRGMDPEYKDISCDELANLPTSKDVINIHHDLRIRWKSGPNESDVRSCYLEGITIFLGTQENWWDFLKLKRTKFAGDIKDPEACAWNNKEIIRRHFPAPPGAVGNAIGKRTWANMCYIDEGYALPLRIRNERGRRYYEFALWFKKHKDLNGIWGVSEEAAAGLKPIEDPEGHKSKKPGFLIFKLDTTVPFCARKGGKDRKAREEEIARMPSWQRYTQEEVERFLRTGKLERDPLKEPAPAPKSEPKPKEADR